MFSTNCWTNLSSWSSKEGPRQCMHNLTLGEHGPYTVCMVPACTWAHFGICKLSSVTSHVTQVSCTAGFISLWGTVLRLVQHLFSPCAVSASQSGPHAINPVVHSRWYTSINQATDAAQGLLAMFFTLTFKLMMISKGSPFPTLYSGMHQLQTVVIKCYTYLYL